MIRSTLMWVCFMVSATAAFAQSPPFQDTLLDQFAGKWVLTGTIDGKETTHDLDAGWILAHEYMQFHEVSREKDSTGAPQYEAFVTIGWDESTKQYACLWLDNTSGQGLTGITAYAPREPGRIAFLFKGKDGSIFHTTFIRERNSDSWRWTMDGEEKGKLQPFARLSMTRE